jgi:hypothetical protein
MRQKVVINFWQPGKAVSSELRALQRLLDQGGENAPLIFAVNGGRTAPCSTGAPGQRPEVSSFKILTRGSRQFWRAALAPTIFINREE